MGEGPGKFVARLTCREGSRRSSPGKSICIPAPLPTHTGCTHTPSPVNMVDSCSWRMPMQRTNVVLDEKLVREGMKLFKKRTKKDLIDFALREIIRREKAKGILALEGKVNWQGDLQEMRKGRFADLG